MKLLKTIFGNALVLSTIVTVLAGMALLSYTDRNLQVDPQTRGVAMKADEGVPHNMVTADAGRGGATRFREQDEGTPPGTIATLSIPSGSIIDAM